jgi:hypothetical protein
MPWAIALVAVVLLAGAGRGADSGEEEPLSPDRYRQVERLYEAQVAMEELAGDSPRLAFERMDRACGRLDRQDELLAAMALSCGESVEWGRALTEVD